MPDTVLLMEKKKNEPERQAPKTPRSRKKKPNIVLRRVGLCAATLVVYLLVAVILTCLVLLRGPSESVRNLLVLSAKQASATKWMPELFLDDDLVREIEQGSKSVTYDVIAMTDEARDDKQSEDEWADAIDGIRFVTIVKPTFKAYLILVRDPSRVQVGCSNNFTGGVGARIFDIAQKYNAVAAINGGEFPDNGGVGTGSNPIGITFSEGKCVWQDAYSNRTFIGFDQNNTLIVTEGMTKEKATSLGIRDGVCFQFGNTLITNDGTNLTIHYANGDTGTAQRTAIGQRKDGTVLLLVTDGRTASSIGATHNDVIEVMLEYGAVVAGKLDGGSSSLMYYRDYFNLYHYDQSQLDQYQKKGLVNKYKAFTEPRRMPTYFVVREAQ